MTLGYRIGIQRVIAPASYEERRRSLVEDGRIYLISNANHDRIV